MTARKYNFLQVMFKVFATIGICISLGITYFVVDQYLNYVDIKDKFLNDAKPSIKYMAPSGDRLILKTSTEEINIEYPSFRESNHDSIWIINEKFKKSIIFNVATNKCLRIDSRLLSNELSDWMIQGVN